MVSNLPTFMNSFVIKRFNFLPPVFTIAYLVCFYVFDTIIKYVICFSKGGGATRKILFRGSCFWKRDPKHIFEGGLPQTEWRVFRGRIGTFIETKKNYVPVFFQCLCHGCNVFSCVLTVFYNLSLVSIHASILAWSFHDFWTSKT